MQNWLTERTTYMPNFSHSFARFRHDLDSALDTLAKLDVPPSRITIRTVSAGSNSRCLVAQSPAPGTVLTPDTTIVLSISRIGFCQGLPAGMWDRGDDSEPGTTQLLDPIDDPLCKAGHWIRQGALLFDISESNTAACARWIRLFGIDPDEWPQDKWYRLSILLSKVHTLAGSEEGIRFALNLLLDLPVSKIHFRPAFRKLDHNSVSHLGQRSSRIGIDFTVGDRLEDLAEFVIVIGPVTIDTYDYHRCRNLVSQVDALVFLLMPCFRQVSICWSVLDETQAPRLGVRSENSVLGVNSHMGLPAYSARTQTSA